MGEEYLYQDLTYEIIGASIDVFKKLGYGYREKVCQRAMAVELKRRLLSFKEQFPIKIYYDGKLIGKYFLDFIVENKIVVEIKVANDFYTRDIKQILSYLIPYIMLNTAFITSI